MLIKDKLHYIFDLMHCRLGSQNWWPARNNFEMIVGAILAQAVSWKNVEKALANLERHKLLCPLLLRGADPLMVEKAVYSTRYYRDKTRRLFSFMEFLWQRYQGDLAMLLSAPLPRLRRELLSIKGIGPETADSILLYAGCKPVFVIDAYTRRIFHRLGLTRADASYRELQDFFMRHTEKDTYYYSEYHALIVKVGSQYCGTRPKCRECPLKAICKLGGGEEET
ncbi:MAG: endonuclease III domain-containing protein [Bacillota bacterium]